MTAPRFVESSAGIQVVVDRRPMAQAWPVSDGAWFVQHRGEPLPARADDRESAEAQLLAMFPASLVST